MFNETYTVKLKTPMGIKKGDLVFSADGTILNGKLLVMGHENSFEGGSVEENRFNFSGEIKTAMGKVAYECTGSIDGEKLTGVAKTKKGELFLDGTLK